MTFQRFAVLLPGLGVPQPRRLVRRRGDDAPAIGAEGRVQNGTLMALEWLADFPAGLGIPHSRRVVRRRGDDALTIGAERRAPHNIRMTSKRLTNLPTGLGVP